MIGRSITKQHALRICTLGWGTLTIIVACSSASPSSDGDGFEPDATATSPQDAASGATDASLIDARAASDAGSVMDAAAAPDAADAASAAYNPPNVSCKPMLNPNTGLFELQFPGSAGNYSKTCSFVGLRLGVRGGNFGVTFSLDADLRAQTGTYRLPAGAFSVIDNGAAQNTNMCDLCFDKNGNGSIACMGGSTPVTASFKCPI